MSTKFTATDDSTDTGWVHTDRGLLHYGWSVGKKVAIVGVAISVAPLAIPTLLVLVALGLALSVPFGIFYAGMVGVERLMQSLLPLGQGQEVKQGDQQEGNEIVEEEKGYLDERDQTKSEENWEWERDDEIVEEGKVYVVRRDSKPEENGEEGEDDDEILEIPGETDTVSEEHGERNKNDVVVESLEERDEVVEKGKGNTSKKGFKTEKAGKDDDGITGIEETGGMTKEEDAIVEIPVDMDASSKEHGEMNKNNVVDSLNVRKRGFEPEKNGQRDDNVKGDTENNGAAVEAIINGNNYTVEEVQVEKGNTDVVEEKEVVIADTDSKLSAVKDASEVEGKSGLVDTETQSPAENVGEIKDVNAASASAESPPTSDAEVN